MSLTVVKLGSTLVADDAGDVRTDVLREVCRQLISRYKLPWPIHRLRAEPTSGDQNVMVLSRRVNEDVVFGVNNVDHLSAGDRCDLWFALSL